ncbi:unnamed protein product [Closterium sp. NIES-53]
MVDRLPALRRGAAPALHKGDLPTQQLDSVPTLCSSRPPSPSGRPPGAPGPPHLPSSYPLVYGPLPLTRIVSYCRRAPLVDRCPLLKSMSCSVDLPIKLPLLVDGPPVAQTSQLQLSSSLVDSNTTAVPCSSTKPVEQLYHCGWSAATPVHPTKSSALPKRGHGQHFTPVNTLDLTLPTLLASCMLRCARETPTKHWEAAKRVLRYLCSTSGMGLVLGVRGPVVLTGHADASWVDNLATQHSSQGYTFSLGSGSISWRSTRSSSVLNSNCEAEIYARDMAAQEIRWLTYLLTDLGERPRSSPILYVDNKAIIALCQDHRLEHRTKHIALRYFLARELQQRGQLCLA